jgi:hypothetical protein
MKPIVCALLLLVSTVIRSRLSLQLEIVALRHQQSPDYQWWHGQPALDGDLLRIKGAVGELYRIPAGATAVTGGKPGAFKAGP